MLAQFSSAAPHARGRFGFAVALLGDLDGDGEGDLAVGAPGEDADQGYADAGRVHLLSGGSGTTILTLSSPEPEPAGYFGWSVLALGDVTGDGIGDLAVGAPGEMPAQSRCNVGRAYLFSGAGGGLVCTLDAPAQAPDGRFGSSMAALNCDGGPVIAVGMPTADDSASGAVFLFDAGGGLHTTLVSPGPAAGGRFGSVVAGGGDLNGDSVRDLLVGAPGEDGGSAYAFDVEDDNLIAAYLPPPSQGAGFFGRAVGSSGDVDGDGQQDVVVGYLVDDAGGWGGKIRVLHGAGAPVAELAAPDPSGSSFGWSTAPVGDVDGDGRGDLAVGAYGTAGQSGEDEAGCVYLMRPSPAEGFVAPERLRLVGPWPNPAREQARVFIPRIDAARVRSVLYDAGGRQVARATVHSVGAQGTELEMRLPADLPSGLYWWHASLGECRTRLPLVVLW
jgi:hypothetical protein